MRILNKIRTLNLKLESNKTSYLWTNLIQDITDMTFLFMKLVVFHKEMQASLNSKIFSPFQCI